MHVRCGELYRMNNVGVFIHANMPFIPVVSLPSALCKFGVSITIARRCCLRLFDGRINDGSFTNNHLAFCQLLVKRTEKLFIQF